MNSKKEMYIELVKNVKDCHICEYIKSPVYSEVGEYLKNDNHGIVDEEKIDIDNIYVNRWNMWQGSLDADIMVIGQDFGKIIIGDREKAETHRWWNVKNVSEWDSPTDENLYEIFGKSFGKEFDLKKPCNKLFFTNIACCYRQNSTSGQANSGWFHLCASKFIHKLIKIIEPKLIIVLGLQTFEALGSSSGGMLVCKRNEEYKNDKKISLTKMIDGNYCFEYQYKDEHEKSIRVCPVFHPGANSKRNRPEKQEDDWKKIKEIYDSLKG